MKKLILPVTILALFLLASCEGLYPTPERESTRREDRYLRLEYIELTVTVLNNLNSQPISDANVTVTYYDETHQVLQSNNNPASASTRTNQHGVAVVRVYAWSTVHQINSNLAHHITSDKTVTIVVDQSDFNTISTSRTYSTEHIRTDETLDRRYLVYAVNGSATVYMSPK